MRKVTKLWTCRDGTKVRICDMSNSHLRHSIAYLEHYASQKREASINNASRILSMVQGEMASLAAESAMDEALDTEESDYLPSIYYDLLKEQERRQQVDPTY